MKKEWRLEEAEEVYKKRMNSAEESVRTTAAKDYDAVAQETAGWQWNLGKIILPIAWWHRYRSSGAFWTRSLLYALGVVLLIFYLLKPFVIKQISFAPAASLSKHAPKELFEAAMRDSMLTVATLLQGANERHQSRGGITVWLSDQRTEESAREALPKLAGVDLNFVLRILLSYSTYFSYHVQSGVCVSDAGVCGFATLHWAWRNLGHWEQNYLLETRPADAVPPQLATCAVARRLGYLVAGRIKIHGAN